MATYRLEIGEDARSEILDALTERTRRLNKEAEYSNSVFKQVFTAKEVKPESQVILKQQDEVEEAQPSDSAVRRTY